MLCLRFVWKYSRHHFLATIADRFSISGSMALGTHRLGGYVCRSCSQQLRRQSRRGYATSAFKPDVYDVVCVGGGPAGLSLLAALRKYNSITENLYSIYPLDMSAGVAKTNETFKNLI